MYDICKKTWNMSKISHDLCSFVSRSSKDWGLVQPLPCLDMDTSISGVHLGFQFFVFFLEFYRCIMVIGIYLGFELVLMNYAYGNMLAKMY